MVTYFSIVGHFTNLLLMSFFRFNSLLLNWMRFWPMRLWMKLGFGKRNCCHSLYSFLIYYLQQFRNNWCLREIPMEMSRCWYPSMLLQFFLHLNRQFGYGSSLNAGCQNWNRENAHSNGRDRVGAQEAGWCLQKRI